jgi:hypothetical protein
MAFNAGFIRCLSTGDLEEGAFLGDVMGLGKTYEAMAYMEPIRYQGLFSNEKSLVWVMFPAEQVYVEMVLREMILHM